MKVLLRDFLVFPSDIFSISAHESATYGHPTDQSRVKCTRNEQAEGTDIATR
jgi:hypothetical protein